MLINEYENISLHILNWVATYVKQLQSGIVYYLNSFINVQYNM